MGDVEIEGISVGCNEMEGGSDGCSVGSIDVVGLELGLAVGLVVGEFVGLIVGDSVGVLVGFLVGKRVGTLVANPSVRSSGPHKLPGESLDLSHTVSSIHSIPSETRANTPGKYAQPTPQLTMPISTSCVGSSPSD